MSQYNPSDSAVPFIGGIILGGLLGATLGVLFAPQSGERTRAQIKAKGEEVYNDAKDKTVALKEEYVDPKVQEAREELARRIEAADEELSKQSKKATAKLKK